MTVEAQINIIGTRPEIWKVITNIHDAAGLISGIESIEILHQPENGLVGLKWRETRMYFGKPSAIDKWITEADEGNYFKTRAEMEGYIFTTTLTLSGNNGNHLLTSSHETTPIGLLARIKSLPMVFFKGMLKKAILQDLRDLKTAVEGQIPGAV
jgi:hypothetical protein